MAGSYNHAVTDEGKLRTKSLGIATENSGDIYETIEEMFGMIWFLANGDPGVVEIARKSYGLGVDLSPGIEEWG